MRPVLLIAISAAAIIGTGAEPSLSDAAVKRAVAYGKRFRSRTDFLQDGLKHKKFKVAGAFARDGASKYITFFDDSDVISAAAAEANQKMRDLSPQDLANIPRTGLLFANVEIHARGLIPVRKMQRRYLDGKAHMVLKFGDTVVQPVKIGTYPSPPPTECYNTMYLWSAFGGYNWGIGGIVPVPLPCGNAGPSKISVEFAFQLTGEQWTQKGQAILIDGDGRRQSVDVDFARLAERATTPGR